MTHCSRQRWKAVGPRALSLADRRVHEGDSRSLAPIGERGYPGSTHAAPSPERPLQAEVIVRLHDRDLAELDDRIRRAAYPAAARFWICQPGSLAVQAKPQPSWQ